LVNVVLTHIIHIYGKNGFSRFFLKENAIKDVILLFNNIVFIS